MKSFKLTVTLPVFLLFTGISHQPLKHLYCFRILTHTNKVFCWVFFKIPSLQLHTKPLKCHVPDSLPTHHSSALSGRSHTLWLPFGPCTAACTSGYSTRHKTPGTQGKLLRCVHKYGTNWWIWTTEYQLSSWHAKYRGKKIGIFPLKPQWPIPTQGACPTNPDDYSVEHINASCPDTALWCF